MRDKVITMYKSGLHADRYEGETDKSLRPGIHYFYKAAILKIIKDEAGKTPYSIQKLLLKRMNGGDAGYSKEIPQPTLTQIRNFKKRHVSQLVDNNAEYDQVSKLIKDLKYDATESDDQKAFSYGAKLGVGSDTDPFIVCFSSRQLLSNMSKYNNHYSVFHIDGTYKLTKNRFPVIAYGRSDTNGQLHLISIAICSNETTETYTHFYK